MRAKFDPPSFFGGPDYYACSVMEIEQQGIMISGLPTDLVLAKILPSISWSDKGSLACASRAWRSAIESTCPFTQITLEALAPSATVQISNGGLCLSIFDPKTEQTSLLPPIPGFQWGFPKRCGLAYGKGVLYVLGGIDPLTEKYMSNVYFINLALDLKAWVECPSLTSARIGFACLMVEDKIYVAGGEEEEFVLATVEVYDVKKRSWDLLPDMPSPQILCIAAAVESFFCILVGFAEGEVFLVEDVYKLKYGCRTWINEKASNELLESCIFLQLGVSSLKLMPREFHGLNLLLSMDIINQSLPKSGNRLFGEL